MHPSPGGEKLLGPGDLCCRRLKSGTRTCGLATSTSTCGNIHELFVGKRKIFRSDALSATSQQLRPVESARLMRSPTLDNCLIQNSTIDFLLPVQLSRRKLPLEFCLLKKPIFLLVVEITHSIGVLDQVIVGIGGRVCLYALQAFKEVSGVDADKAIDGKRLADHARLEVPRHQSVDILRGPSVGHAN